MKYSKEERIEIGRRVHEGELTYLKAQQEYSVSEESIRRYVHTYRESAGIHVPSPLTRKLELIGEDISGYEKYQNMTKDELIDELIRAKVAEARAKKGYEVKGGGPNKEYVILSNKTTK